MQYDKAILICLAMHKCIMTKLLNCALQSVVPSWILFILKLSSEKAKANAL